MANKKITVLNQLLTQIEACIPYKEKTNPIVSSSNVGWQLYHTLKVINNVSAILEKTDPKNYKKDFNLARAVMFPIGYIPRGKAKAPKVVTPPETILTEDLENQLAFAKTHIKNIQNLDKKAYFKHHIFGTLPKATTIRFLEIHTKHHLKIISDILNK